MKALSIQPPWSYCITHGTKRVENRTWWTSHRGPFLIHAGRAYQRGVEDDIHADSPEMDPEAMRKAHRGGLVGVATLVDCVDVHEGHERIAPDQRIWTGRSFAFVLTDVIAFPTMIPYRGALGFFHVAGPELVAARAYIAAAHDDCRDQ